MHLPHFIAWVTEIATVDSYNQASAGFRRIYGHTVLNATSTGKDTAGLLMLHVPGMGFLRNVDAKPGEQAETGIVIQNDALYECREKASHALASACRKRRIIAAAEAAIVAGRAFEARGIGTRNVAASLVASGVPANQPVSALSYLSPVM